MIALPAWLLTNAIIVAGLSPLAWLLCRLCRTRPAVAHLVWLVLMAKLVVPPLVYWQWSLPQLSGILSGPRTNSRPVAVNETLATSAEIQPVEISTRVRETQIHTEQSTYEPPPANFDPQPVADLQWNLASIVFLLWSVGAGATALGGLRALWLQSRALRVGQPAPDYLTRRISELATQIGICPPRALIRQRLSTPVLCCVGRPRLLWPSEMSDPQTVARSDGVLAHELAHIKRRDHWTVYLELLTAIVCWWNPLFWLIRRQLHETRELACDALALAVARQPRADYAKELLSISTARYTTIDLAPAFGAGLASRHFLKRRLTMVFDDRVSPRTPAVSIALLLMLAAVALPAVTLAQQSAVSSAPSDAQPAFVEEQPVAQSNSSTTTPALDIPSDDSLDSSTPSKVQRPVNVYHDHDPHSPTTQSDSQTPANPYFEPLRVPETTVRKLGRFNPSGPRPDRIFLARLPNGGGILRVSKNDDGTIEIGIEQDTGQLNEGADRSNFTRAPAQATNRPTSSIVSGTTRPSVTGVNTTVASQLLRDQGRFDEAEAIEREAPSPTSALQPTVSGVAPLTFSTAANTSLSSRAALDKEMLKSDVDLAKINLEEKMVQADIAKKDGSDQDRVHLAQLAVRRAQIELERAELQLKKGISASRR